jgi:hypothetical protein
MGLMLESCEAKSSASALSREDKTSRIKPRLRGRVSLLADLVRGFSPFYYCKASPHPYRSVMLDSMEIGALLGRNPSQKGSNSKIRWGAVFAVVLKGYPCARSAANLPRKILRLSAP